MPWLLSFAAGAMLYVVVEELIPEANLRHDHETHGGTFGVMAGFLIMMILDVAPWIVHALHKKSIETGLT